jgi:hypothetical protein
MASDRIPVANGGWREDGQRRAVLGRWRERVDNPDARVHQDCNIERIYWLPPNVRLTQAGGNVLQSAITYPPTQTPQIFRPIVFRSGSALFFVVPDWADGISDRNDWVAKKEPSRREAPP